MISIAGEVRDRKAVKTCFSFFRQRNDIFPISW
jgi:hypothetical protein